MTYVIISLSRQPKRKIHYHFQSLVPAHVVCGLWYFLFGAGDCEVKYL